MLPGLPDTPTMLRMVFAVILFHCAAPDICLRNRAKLAQELNHKTQKAATWQPFPPAYSWRFSQSMLLACLFVTDHAIAAITTRKQEEDLARS
jgi:hypothetical protein